MSRFQSFGAPLIAALVGVASGVYIFKPLIESSMTSMQDDLKLKKTLEASVSPSDPAKVQ